MHLASLSRTIFLSQIMGKGGGGILDYVPFWGPGHLDWTKLAQCISKSCILQNKTINRPLRHIIGFFIFWLSPPVGPQGVRTGPKMHMHNYTMGQQHETINRSLLYLVTEEIEEQDIVYGQTDRQTDRQTDGRTEGRTMDERVSHKLDWSLTSRAKNGHNIDTKIVYERR